MFQQVIASVKLCPFQVKINSGLYNMSQIIFSALVAVCIYVDSLSNWLEPEFFNYLSPSTFASCISSRKAKTAICPVSAISKSHLSYTFYYYLNYHISLFNFSNVMGMRKELKEPFNNGKAYELIMKIRQYSLKEAGKILQIFVDEGG